MRILVLDIATSTGYAIYDKEKERVIEHGTFRAHTKDNWGKGLSEFEKWLDGVILEYKVCGIVAEQTYIPYANENKSTTAFKRLCELHGILEKVAYEKELPINFVEARAHHTSLCGYQFKNREEIKAETIKRVKCLFGEFFIENDNEADAISILLYWLKVVGLDLYLPNNRKFH